MPIQTTDIKFLRAGTSGLGGAISAVSVGSALFDDVLPAESADGRINYRCSYLKNGSTFTWGDVVAWINANTPSPSTIIEIGVGTSAVNGVEQTVANEETAPDGVTFVPAATKAAGVALGTLPAAGWRAVWFKRTVTAGAAARLSDSWTPFAEGLSL